MRKGPDYTCDDCKNLLSDRGTGEDHLSLVIGPESGLASMLGAVTGWRIAKRLRARRYHFCNTVCQKNYFDTVLFGNQPVSTLVN